MSVRLPYGRISAFYFAFFAVLGVLSPYWGPYLKGRGFEAAEIGTLIALLHVTKIIAPNLWGWLADTSGRRMAIIRLSCIAALFGFSGVLVPGGFWWMAAVMVAFSFFWNAALPQFEANTFNHLADQTHQYARIRLWGTVGFMVAVLAVGEGIDQYGIEILPSVLLGLFLLLALISLLVPQASAKPTKTHSGAFKAVMLQPAVIGLLVACFLMQVSHGPFYAFYSIFLQDHGYSSTAIGALWAVALVAEIGVFLMMPRWLPYLSPQRVLMLVMGLAAVRWLLVAFFPAVVSLQVLAQLLHAGTYGAYHAVAISLINRYFEGGLQGRGQAIYSSMTFGAGIAVGSFVGGQLWEAVGGVWTFALSAGVAFIAMLIVQWALSAYNLRDNDRTLS